jgi:hypothetical protein
MSELDPKAALGRSCPLPQRKADVHAIEASKLVRRGIPGFFQPPAAIFRIRMLPLNRRRIVNRVGLALADRGS